MAKQQASASGKSAFSKQLAAMRERWNQQKEESKKIGGGSTTLSEGRHACKLTDARLVASDKGLSVKLEFTCVDGDEVGEKAVRWAGLDTDEKISYLQRDLRRLGVDVDELEIDTLEKTLADLLAAAPSVRITVKQSSDYLNCYVDKLIDTDGGEAGEAGEAGESEEAGEAEPTVDESEGEASEEPGEAEEPGEEPAEEPGEEPEAETFENGDRISYVLKGATYTATVLRSYNQDDGETVVEAKDDRTKKNYTLNVNKYTVEKLVPTEPG